VSKPIYRVIIEYGYRKKGAVRAYQYKIIDTFVLTNDLELIKKDETIRKKIMAQVKTRHTELDITFKNIYIEGQYGETNH
jgi:hypothetical protein|tara:strand:- start:349 stop:588 length:240 start_codon:yes stop_codon:yes gene_type:complete